MGTNIGIYRVTAKRMEELQSGQYYGGFDCSDCALRFAVFDLPNNVGIAGDGSFRVACPHCGTDSLYPMDSLTRFQHVAS